MRSVLPKSGNNELCVHTERATASGCRSTNDQAVMDIPTNTHKVCISLILTSLYLLLSFFT